jgi:cell division protein FtsB
MPYSSISEVPSYVPQEKRKQWLDVWNSAHAKAKKEGKSDKDAEASAFAQANGVAGPKSTEKSMNDATNQEFGFFKLVKADARTHTIHGVAAAEVPDKVGEIFDYESSKPLIKAWSEERFRDSGGKSLGNVREQHTSRAVGKLTDLLFNDAAKQIEVDAGIVEDDVWAKIEEGIYAGFSFGGRYEKKWKDDKNLTRYTARPFELTVCDNQCVPGASFQMVKSDGTVEMRKFAELNKKSVGEKRKGGVLYLVHEGENGHLPYTHEDGKPNHRLMGAAWAALHDGYRGNKYEGPNKEAAISKLTAIYKKEGMETPGSGTEKLAKSLWDVGRMADLLQTIYSVQTCLEAEAEWEGDGSDIPARLKTWLTEGVSILTDLAEEEGQELISKKEGDESMTPEQTALLEKATGLIDRVDKLEKMAAHHKAHVIAIKGHHEAMAAHIAALHDGADGKDGAEKLAKEAAAASAPAAAATPTPNAEVEALKTEVADLKKGFTDFLEELGKAFPKKSDLPAGAVAKVAGGTLEKGKEGAPAEEAPREVTTPGGNKVDLAKFGRDTLAKPLFVNPTIAR